MSGKDLKLSRQADLNKKRGRPLRLLKSPLTSNGRGDSSRREIEPKLTPEVFRTPATAVKIKTGKKRGVRPPFVQRADNLVARHSPQQRVGVDTGLTPYDPGERIRRPASSLASRMRLKSLSHLVTDVKTDSGKSSPSFQEETEAGVKMSPRFEEPLHEGGELRVGVKSSPHSSGFGESSDLVGRVGVKNSPHSLKEKVSPHEGGGLGGVGNKDSPHSLRLSETSAGVGNSSPKGGNSEAIKAGVKLSPRFEMPPHERGGAQSG